MQLIESVLKKALKKKIKRIHGNTHGNIQQGNTIRYLLKKAKNTDFGQHYNFGQILKSDNIVKVFQENVPIFNYEKIHEEWWHKLLKGKENITWPGKTNFFGLTSGTSNDSSKRVPVTNEMIKAMQKTGTRQLYVLAGLNLPPKFLQKKILMLGGSTQLIKVKDYFEGDLSGILTGRLPIWFSSKYKPGKQISRVKDWDVKLNKIVKEAPKWDIGGIAGVPAWVQMLLERIIYTYGLETIHDIWPNFCVYSHGGVSFEPYKKSFNKLLSKDIYYLETYLASEGFLAYQTSATCNMQLVLDNGIFFEFVPFNSNNFDHNGNIKENAKALLIDEVEQHKDYAILISTVSGAWRYLIGDTIRFTSTKKYEIIITGRTKHFLSLCGEHLSVDNMNKAIEIVSNKLNIDIKEFTVAGIQYENLFAHKWFLGVSCEEQLDKTLIRKTLDKALMELNDDYAVERKAALKEIFVEVIHESTFYQWMQIHGKMGGQNKFPRVLNGKLKEWENYLANVLKFPDQIIKQN
jgi:hypothetical protein